MLSPGTEGARRREGKGRGRGLAEAKLTPPGLAYDSPSFAESFGWVLILSDSLASTLGAVTQETVTLLIALLGLVFGVASLDGQAVVGSYTRLRADVVIGAGSCVGGYGETESSFVHWRSNSDGSSLR